MTLCRLIAPQWLLDKHPATSRVLEGVFSDEDIQKRNKEGYNIYFLPNGPKDYDSTTTLTGKSIDDFRYVFVDFDLKSGTYSTKEDFMAALDTGLPPSLVIDSGNGVHSYWQVNNLDAMSYLRLSRRLTRYFKTDEAVGKIFQLMRLPGTLNTKVKDDPKKCEVIFEDETTYEPDALDKFLPPITPEDEDYCKRHYDQTYGTTDNIYNIEESLPTKFGALLAKNKEVQAIWNGETNDRSKNDYRLGHVLLANSFSKEEAIRVLINSAKALGRGPQHRISYAMNIVDKIWTYEEQHEDSKDLSKSVEDILKKGPETLRGTRFRCDPHVDNTECGFRLGHVIGLVAGVGVGKTSFALNMFRWFAQYNPDYHHFFVSLEQPAGEIADRWNTICQGDTTLHKKVHIISNYEDDGSFRHLSLDDIKDYILDWQKKNGKKAGCVVIDHIGVLKKKGANDENQDLLTICHNMKAFAVQTNTLLVMQSQTNRSKAGVGDLELDKDSAYGTLLFEAYCDYLITLWQPLKRCHSEENCPTVTAFKFCKIRHKKPKKDVVQEDVRYYLYFDSNVEQFRDMTQAEKEAFQYFLRSATNKRNADKKSEVIEYRSVPSAKT